MSKSSVKISIFYSRNSFLNPPPFRGKYSIVSLLFFPPKRGASFNKLQKMSLPYRKSLYEKKIGNTKWRHAWWSRRPALLQHLGTCIWRPPSSFSSLMWFSCRQRELIVFTSHFILIRGHVVKELSEASVLYLQPAIFYPPPRTTALSLALFPFTDVNKT